MKFRKGNAEIELFDPNTFNVAIRAGFEKVEELEQKKLPADGFYNCKKCDFKTENKGELLAHYRTEHPKKQVN